MSKSSGRTTTAGQVGDTQEEEETITIRGVVILHKDTRRVRKLDFPTFRIYMIIVTDPSIIKTRTYDPELLVLLTRQNPI